MVHPIGEFLPTLTKVLSNLVGKVGRQWEAPLERFSFCLFPGKRSHFPRQN